MIGKTIKDRYRIYEIGQCSLTAIHPLTRKVLEREKAIPVGMASVLHETSADVRFTPPTPLSGWA